MTRKQQRRKPGRSETVRTRSQARKRQLRAAHSDIEIKIPPEVRAKASELVRDPRFLYRVGQKIAELGIVNENTNRAVIVLAGIANQSIVIKGESSTGKNELMRQSIKVLPPEWIMTRASLSKKALVHGQDSLDGKILYLMEDMGGKEAKPPLRLLQSEGEVTHEFTTVRGSERKTAKKTRSGKLAVFTTTTQPKIYADDETRALSLYPDTSSEQTRAILRAKLAGPGPEKEPPVEVFQQAIRLIASGNVSFKRPNWFGYLAENMSADQVRVRRDLPRFLSLLEAIALCRRFATGHDGDLELEISFADYCVAHRLLNSVFKSTLEGMPQQEIEIAEAVRKLYASKKKAVRVSDIAEHLKWSEDKSYKYAKAAVDHGLIACEPGTRPHNVKRFLPKEDARHDFLPSPRDVFDANPEIGNEVSYIHPLTGKKRTLRRDDRT
jgi:hypothetical protein